MNTVMCASFDIGYLLSDISDDESTDKRDTREEYQRFLPPVSEEQLCERVRQRVPRGTAKANSWAFNVWREWACHRNNLAETQQDRYFPVPVDLVGFSYEALDYWLSLFVMEVRRRDRSAYPPNSLFQLVAGLQHFLREERSLSDVVFFSKSSSFARLRKSLDCRMKELTAAGIGVRVLHADPVTVDDEVQLWRSGVLNTTTSKGLSYAVFLYNCKTFGLRGNTEHRNLDASQFVLRCDDTGENYVQFYSWNSKTFQGGLDQRRMQPRIVKQYAVRNANNMICVYDVFAAYLKMIPSCGPFYRTPLTASFGFGKHAVGVNTLGKYMQTMFSAADIDARNRKIVNHSGRVSCCTRLYNSGFDDKAIMSRSGHRSDAVHGYKRPSFEQEMSVSKALDVPDFGSVCACSDVKRQCTNAENMSHDDDKDDVLDRVSAKPCSSSAIMRIVLPENVDTVVICKNGREITLTIA